MDNAYAVEMRGIVKAFRDVVANQDVDFSAYWGEVHALVGENGAGKSTLMNILYGIHKPDSGTIYIDGKEATISSPQDALRYGIGMVHQQFMLVERFTALENLILGKEPVRSGVIDKGYASQTINNICTQMKLNVNIDTHVSNMSVSSKQKIEIIKAIYRGAKILILDEPTSILSPQESMELFMMLREMAKNGMCIIFISHKLGDVMEYSDRVTVLRKGRHIATMPAHDMSIDQLARLMVGTEVSIPTPRNISSAGREKTVLKIESLTVMNDKGAIAVDAADLDVKAGEIVGIAGVDGNGQQELVEAAIGIRKGYGHIVYDGIDVIDLPVNERLSMGISYIPEDPESSIIKEFSVVENAILGLHCGDKFCRWGTIDYNAAREFSRKLIDRYNIDAGSLDMAVGHLSGGNMQKLIIARALESCMRLLFACQPTRGLDVSASAYVYDRFFDAAENGVGILLISHDLDELLLLSNRIAVMYKGKVVKVFNRNEATKELIGMYMVGAAQ